jgi:hypothetical protein
MNLAPLLVGSGALIVNMFIQIAVIVAIIDYLLRFVDKSPQTPALGADIRVMSIVFLALFAGHVAQFALWAWLFMYLGEFNDFDSAFYHSAVNFTSLGYGDIVMSEKWRLLGPLEAANGILMFGLTAGSFLALMLRLLGRHASIAEARTRVSGAGETGEPG